MSTVNVTAALNGTLTYELDLTPSKLPPVRTRDILATWDVARDAARRAIWESERAFRFRQYDGSWMLLTVDDRDARCWAGAVDRVVGMRTGYGISVCLRLLALLDLLARSRWMAGFMKLDTHGTVLHPELLKLAAETQLTDDAGFDEARFYDRLHSLAAAGRHGRV